MVSVLTATPYSRYPCHGSPPSNLYGPGYAFRSVTDTADGGTDFIHVPPGTPTGFPVTQLFSNERREFNVPLAKRVVADLNTALLEQFLHIPVAAKRRHRRCPGQEAEREAVVKPNRVLDDADWEAVAIGHGVSHGPTLPDNLTEPSGGPPFLHPEGQAGQLFRNLPQAPGIILVVRPLI